MKRVPLIVAFGIAVLAGGGFLAYTRLNDVAVAPEPLVEETDTPQELSQFNETPKLIIGRVEAPITIINYGDFQCPICKRFFETTEPQLLKEWIDTGKAKIEFRVEAHIGEGSAAAGEAAYCANDQSKFQAMHDAIFRRQGKATFNNALMKSIAAEIKLDLPAFNHCLDAANYRGVVETSHKEAQKVISGTPTFFIGEQKIVGAQPYSIFKTVLESQ